MNEGEAGPELSAAENYTSLNQHFLMEQPIRQHVGHNVALMLSPAMFIYDFHMSIK